jgi:hypothetical protein
LVAVADTVYISTNSGALWLSTTSYSFSAVAISADGTKLVGANEGGGWVYVSTDLGTTWVSTDSPAGIGQTVAVSADGNEIVAAGSGLVAMLRPPAPTPPVPPSPRISIRLSGANSSLSWLMPSTGFVLQQNSDLASPNWPDVVNQPTLNFTNLHYEVPFPPASGNAFYRLKSQ